VLQEKASLSAPGQLENLLQGDMQMLYLVSATGGPTFHTREEVLEILENTILPGFAALKALEADGKILAGGLPVGERAFIFIIDAPNNKALDDLLRELPFWPVLEWDVVPLQSFASRAAHERKTVAALKGK
jgi:muconolactone delta-isomerase